MTEAVLARAQADVPSAFQRWLEALPDSTLAILRAGGPQAAQDFLVAERLREPEWSCLSPFDVRVAVGLVERWGWDPNRRFRGDEFPPGPEEKENPLRPHAGESFLGWMVRTTGGIPGRGQDLEPTLDRWPTTLDAFLAMDAEHAPPRTLEWFLAFLLAAGATPWQGDGEDGHVLIQDAVNWKCPRLTLQALALPGAPTLRKAFDAPDLGRETFGVRTWLDGMIHRAHYERPFLQAGRVPEKANVTMILALLQAYPDCRIPKRNLDSSLPPAVLRLLADTGRLSVEEGLAMEAAMDRRGDVDHPDYVAWRAALPQHRWPKAQLWAREATAYGQRTVDTLWDKPQPWRMSWDQEFGRGPEWLLQVADVTGPMAGRWRVAHLQALAALSSSGFSSWKWVFPDGIAPAGGALATLLDEDLPDGLPALGLWGLALLGRTSLFIKHPEIPRDPTPAGGIDADELDDYATLFGVADWRAFARDAVDPMVRMTEWLSGRAHPSHLDQAVAQLRWIWSRALERCPSLFEGRADLAHRVLDALEGRAVVRWNALDQRGHSDETCDAARGWPDLGWRMRGRAPWECTDLGDLDGDPETAAHTLAVALRARTHHPADWEGLAQWLTDHPTAAASRRWLSGWLERMETHVRAEQGQPKYRVTSAHVARLREAVWMGQMPSATSRSGARERL